MARFRVRTLNGSGTKHQRGLTLLEVLVTLGLLAFVLMSLGKLQT
ncbi:MAG: prepilin-type N-terminal cleavage/methylation domain-containing protein, partial [Gammaproteobacteria bacterium]